MRAAEVVVIGGGVIGASVAYHLALRGCKQVIVLERAVDMGAGSTGKATGGFRCQYSTVINVQLSLFSLEKLLRFKEETGIDSGYDPRGYLFMARNEAQLSTLRDAMKVQQSVGVREVQEVSVEDIRCLNPAVNTEDFIGGTFCSLDGFTRPMNLLKGYTEAAQRLGVRFEYGTGDVEVIVEQANRRVLGVRTATMEFGTRCVVNAAGAWASEIAGKTGVSLPVKPVRRQVAVTQPFDRLPSEMPMTIDVEDGFHLRVRDGRVLLLLPLDTPKPDPYDTSFEPSWLNELLPRAHHRIPVLKEAAIDLTQCHCGLYEMSPDKHAIVGEASELGGFYLVNGSSGHGVMHSPALGQLVSEMILDGVVRSLDIHSLRPSRFAENDLNADTGVL
jgi:sarcosine oxidase subunit beta